mmetsp:Transcript_16752/g.36379  ORF Transcript_16752/g.36379 Transcript_16752/m.36379 type:complete len:111 (+) Transcript_16752:107-439(+)|eukprot:CAMPEP_0206568814 /NCGR_PEP_ID=MMETSP0325_2-20121206/26055_1 /ASSEMBLY_ACC=CAM_ASM_000347 /TAXON_ID=2866 /ORGANISM="Crypthecodinium cohnii, Strain Seligo" /LENGTH=110 /DNA_ID=CAMNT_0054072261 /DNA_START=1 /DNA_END=333 /DNA_ORIENTATION=+
MVKGQTICLLEEEASPSSERRGRAHLQDIQRTHMSEVVGTPSPKGSASKKEVCFLLYRKCDAYADAALGNALAYVAPPICCNTSSPKKVLAAEGRLPTGTSWHGSWTNSM